MYVFLGNPTKIVFPLQIHKNKVTMNKEIMSLRDLKVSVIDEIKSLVQELKSIQAALDLSERAALPLIPQLYPDEVPEKKFQYDSDILLKFKEEQEAKAKLQKQLEGSATSQALSHGFRRASSIKESDPMAQAAHLMKSASSLVTEQQRAFEIEKAEPMEMELEILKRKKIKSLYLQETLIKKVGNQVIFVRLNYPTAAEIKPETLPSQDCSYSCLSDVQENAIWCKFTV